MALGKWSLTLKADTKRNCLSQCRRNIYRMDLDKFGARFAVYVCMNVREYASDGIFGALLLCKTCFQRCPIKSSKLQRIFFFSHENFWVTFCPLILSNFFAQIHTCCCCCCWTPVPFTWFVIFSFPAKPFSYSFYSLYVMISSANTEYAHRFCSQSFCLSNRLLDALETERIQTKKWWEKKLCFK